MLLLALIAPAAGAAGVNQGSSDEFNYYHQDNFEYIPLRSSVSFPVIPTDSSNAMYIGTNYYNRTLYTYQSLGSSPIYIFFVNGTGFYYASLSSDARAILVETGNSTGRWDLNVFDAGYNAYVRYMQGSSNTSDIPSSIPKYANYDSAMTDLMGAIHPSEAVLIEPSASYEWCTGFSLTNSGSSAIAGGWVGNNFYLATYTAGYSISNSQTSVNFALFDQSTDLYYSMIPLQGQESDRIGPVFDTAADFFASAVVVLDDSPTPAPTPTPGTNTFQVPNGYVAYLHLADPTAEIKLTAHFNRPSMLVGDGSGSAWPNSQTYRFGAYLPIEPTQYPVSGSSYIRWFKAAGNQNVFGQTLDGVATLTGGSNLIEIYNPATQSFQLDSQQIYDNPTLFGETTGGILSCVKYELTDNITAGGSITSGFTGGEPVPDPDENDGDGNFINPSTTPGGGTDPVSGNSLQDILNNFFNRFLGLFTEGYQAIRNLTQSSSQFVSRLSELYSWLPSEILTVLTSAIILAIIIGVLKVFL